MATKCLLFILLITINFGCYSPSPEERFENERHAKIDNILRKFTKLMSSQGCDAVGIGMGIDHSTGKQNYIKVVLDIDALPSIEFAREIELKAIQEFLECINSEPGIEEYVAEYPYPIKFIHVVFVSENSEKGLFSVANSREELYYDIEDPANPGYSLIEVHSESHEEALHIHSQK